LNFEIHSLYISAVAKKLSQKIAFCTYMITLFLMNADQSSVSLQISAYCVEGVVLY
jgi:hypothetical protein